MALVDWSISLNYQSYDWFKPSPVEHTRRKQEVEIFGNSLTFSHFNFPPCLLLLFNFPILARFSSLEAVQSRSRSGGPKLQLTKMNFVCLFNTFPKISGVG